MYKMTKQQFILPLFLFLGLLAQAQESSFSFSLAEAQQYAIEHSYQSQTANKEVEKSKRKVKETISTGLPQINASGSYQNFLELPRQLVPAEFFWWKRRRICRGCIRNGTANGYRYNCYPTFV